VWKTCRLPLIFDPDRSGEFVKQLVVVMNSGQEKTGHL